MFSCNFAFDDERDDISGSVRPSEGPRDIFSEADFGCGLKFRVEAPPSLLAMLVGDTSEVCGAHGVGVERG